MTADTEQMVPLRAALAFLARDPAAFSDWERLRLRGLIQHYLGDRAEAASATAEAAEMDDEDLLANYYLIRSLDGTLAETADTRRQVLERAIAYTKSGEMELEPLYYCGHIFLINGLLEAAVRCFGRCGTMLPALYMEVAVIRQMDARCDLTPYIDFLLKEEARQTRQSVSGFLNRCELLPLDPQLKNWPDVIGHYAHTREITDAVNLVNTWLADYERRNGTPHPALAALR